MAGYPDENALGEARVSDIKLVVQGDDLGMCRAVNEGIALAKTDGILTQASVMAPTPWFAEGAAIVRRAGLPVGLHVTLTCEWDYLRWSPLSPATTLRGADGTFHRTVEDAATADPGEAVAEAHAQADRATALGLTEAAASMRYLRAIRRLREFMVESNPG